MEKIELRELQLLQLKALKETVRICNKHNVKYFMIGGTLIGAVRHKGFIPWDDDIDIAMYRNDYDKFVSVCGDELADGYFMQHYKTDKDYYSPLTRICINDTYILDKLYEHLKFHKGLYIDIFPLDNIPNDKKKRVIQKKKIQAVDKLMLYKAFIVWTKGSLRLKLIGKYLLKKLYAPISLKYLHQLREKYMKLYVNEKTEYVCSTASKYGYDKQVIRRQIYGEPRLIEFEDGLFCAPQEVEAYLTHLFGNYMKLPPVEQQLPTLEVYKTK